MKIEEFADKIVDFYSMSSSDQIESLNFLFY